VIVFFASGKMMITKISDKKFMGKNIIHCAIWKKGDIRTIYHLIYRDGKEGSTMMKRFSVKSITRDKEYDITKGTKGSKVYYFAVHPNGEREVVTVHLRPRPHLKRIRFEIDFGALLIKGRGSAGNRVTKEIVAKVLQKEVGESTLPSRKIWYDKIVGRLNVDERGDYLGAFKGDDRILTLYSSGAYRLTNFDIANHFDDDLIHVEKWNPEHPISAVYFEGEKEMHYVKRFLIETKSDKKTIFITEHEKSVLDLVSTSFQPIAKIIYNKRLRETKNLADKEVNLAEFIDVKGMKSLGNQLTKLKVKEIELTHGINGGEPWPDDQIEEVKLIEEDSNDDSKDEGGVKSNEMEWDVTKPTNGPIIEEDDDNQPSLF